MATSLSNKEKEDEQFNEVMNNYKEKYGAYPLSASQLLSHASDIGKQLRYSFLKKAFQTWNDQNCGSQKSGKAELLEANDEIKEQEIDWNVVWTDYENTYSHPPKQALHLWNHSKDMKFNVKYSEVKKLFPSLQLKKMGMNGQEREENESMKKKEIKKEELKKSVDEYCNKYKSYPKDAKMLFHFCVNELSMNVTFKAVSIAFSSFCNENPQTKAVVATPPPVMTRFGYFVNYDDFVSGNTNSSTVVATPPPSQEVPVVAVPATPTVSVPVAGVVTNNDGGETDVILVSVTDAGVTKGNLINDLDIIPAVSETLQSPKKEESNKKTSAVSEETEPGSNSGALKNESEKKMKKEMTSELFNEIKTKYQTAFQKAPQNPVQMLHFANDNGYSVTYAAIRRVWASSNSC